MPDEQRALADDFAQPAEQRPAPAVSRGPWQMPSIIACSGGFLEAKASTRASTMQLVTISGMKMPSTR